MTPANDSFFSTFVWNYVLILICIFTHWMTLIFGSPHQKRPHFLGAHTERPPFFKETLHRMPPIFVLRSDVTSSGVARAFPGGRRRAKVRKKIRKVWGKIDRNLRKKWGKWNSCPPGTVRLATALVTSIFECPPGGLLWHGPKDTLPCTLHNRNSPFPSARWY